jgi:DNA repair protein RecO (recombination protein O)
MEWSEEGIVLAARRHGESALIVQLLTREHGRHLGLVRGGQGPKLRGVYQTGNRLAVTWKARLAEHLGHLSGELLRGPAASFLDDPARLACLSAAAALAESTLPEREPHPRAFASLSALLDSLVADEAWAVRYAEWELTLLAELGFGLDLSRCAATGETEDLIYVSPKSGHAVSAKAGAPYRGRLLALPRFLLPGSNAEASPADVLDALALADHFLERRVFAPHDRKMPAARTRFVEILRRMAKVSANESS